MKIELIDDIDRLWKRWSTRIAASQAAMVAFWAGLPHEWKEAIPEWAVTFTVALLAVSFITAQTVKQKAIEDDKQEEKQGV